jgi:hypothetical protein
MDERQREQLLEDLVERLREEGAPGGTWLLEIDAARGDLHRADDLLRRLRDVIIQSCRDRVPE